MSKLLCFTLLMIDSANALADADDGFTANDRRKLRGPSFTRDQGYQAGGSGRGDLKRRLEVYIGDVMEGHGNREPNGWFSGWHCDRDCGWLIAHGLLLATTPFMFMKRRLDAAEPAADLADLNNFVPGPDSLPRIKQGIHTILTRAQLEKDIASELEQLVNTLEEQRQIASSEHINVEHLLNLEDTKMQVEHQLGAHLSSLGIAGDPFAATDNTHTDNTHTDNTHMEDGTSGIGSGSDGLASASAMAPSPPLASDDAANDD